LRRFAPHITLGRVRGRAGGSAMTASIARFQQFIAGRMRVDEIVVYASRLSRGGPTYMPLGRIKLA
jgi:RNA 2',3'-cyclic 3'-phosphodiesterase